MTMSTEQKNIRMQRGRKKVCLACGAYPKGSEHDCIESYDYVIRAAIDDTEETSTQEDQTQDEENSQKLTEDNSDTTQEDQTQEDQTQDEENSQKLTEDNSDTTIRADLDIEDYKEKLKIDMEKQKPLDEKDIKIPDAASDIMYKQEETPLYITPIDASKFEKILIDIKKTPTVTMQDIKNYQQRNLEAGIVLLVDSSVPKNNILVNQCKIAGLVRVSYIEKTSDKAIDLMKDNKTIKLEVSE